ncbi:MAG: family 10 glycosylhydrolase [Phormidesmis sp.]
MVSRIHNKSCHQRWRRIVQSTVVPGLMVLLAQGISAKPAQAEVNRFCQLSSADVEQKESLRLAGQQGDRAAQQQYESLRQQHSDEVESCRQKTWPQNQAIWLRLYPCDLQPGRLDEVMDRIVNLGYNQVYIEAFSNGQVLLPKNNNPTVWPSVVQSNADADRDLLAEAISAAHDRDIKAYAWMFTINFGYSYGQRADRRQVLARNAAGADTRDYADNGTSGTSEEAFIDPYNPTARADYLQMVRAVLQRKPDGALYDYVRYPRLKGAASVVSKVSDLWIYGPAANQALIQRAANNKGRALIQRFLQNGYITNTDVAQVDSLYPDEGEPLWQGRNPPIVAAKDLAPAAERRPGLQDELWRLSVAHAIQGIVDFLQVAATPAQQAGISTGAVFFPGGNRAVGSGYDARLQHWNRFPESLDAHPMAYALCGNASCIVDEVQQVLKVRRNPATVKPALAGVWGATQRDRPSLEAQMDALQRSAPQINTVSHFALSWQDAEFDRYRKTCPVSRSAAPDLDNLRGSRLPENSVQSASNPQ